MSEAILTYRACAKWMMENSRIVARREDAERLVARAERLKALADRLERQEQDRVSIEAVTSNPLGPRAS